jgi:hypothetical protein
MPSELQRHLAHLRLLEAIAEIDGVGLASIRAEIREVEVRIEKREALQAAARARAQQPAPPQKRHDHPPTQTNDTKQLELWVTI